MKAESREPAKQESAAQAIFRTLLGAGFQCYLVGGSVRDRMLGRLDADLDFTTNARPADVLRLFPRSYYPNRFGTVIVVLRGVRYEITTYRGEGRYSDHRHPDQVSFVDSLEDDLRRRDFTVNALAMDVSGTIIDPVGGCADLKNRLIRAVGDASERLAEDPLRMMRAARLATHLSFSIDQSTWQAIRDRAGLLSMISRERVRDELLKILASDHPVTGIDLLDHLGLLPDVLPELVTLQRLNRPPNEECDSYQHALQSLRSCPGDARLRLVALLHGLLEDPGTPVGENGRPDRARLVAGAMARLRFSNAEVEEAHQLAAGVPDVLAELTIDERTARQLLNHHGQRLPKLLLLVEAHRRAQGGSALRVHMAQLRHLKMLVRKVQKEQQPHSLRDLAITGHDLIQTLGMPPGAGVGRALKLLLTRVLDDPSLNDTEILLQIAKEELVPTAADWTQSATGDTRSGH